MKYDFKVYFITLAGLVGFMLLLAFIQNAYADTPRNQALKECLAKHGFVAGKTHVLNYNWNLASACTSKKHIEITKQEIERERAFVRDNPWYTGKTWNWDEYAKEEYVCERVHSTALANTITVCHKPMFIN